MFVGIDVGTQSLKAVVTDDRLRVTGAAAVGYSPSFPRSGWAEQDVSLWEQALAPAIGQALQQAGAAPRDINALGVCGQLDGCVAVDTAARALGPCLIWSDRRAVDCLPPVCAAEMLRLTGVVADATHMAAKIRWLKTHGGTATSAACYHQPVSYLVCRLTGESVYDDALASTTMLYGLERRDYEPALLDAFGIERAELPRIAAASDQAGRLTPRGAAMTGLAPGTPLAVGTGDDFSNPLGAGLSRPGPVICTVGTAEVVGALHPQPTIDPGALVETHRYITGSYFLENPGWLAGGAVTWLCRLLGIDSAARLTELAGGAPPGCDGLVFLPALSGAMAPEWIAGARGAFYGIEPGHDRTHFCRALLEGCAFAMRDVIDRLAQLGVATDTVTMTGGGAHSRLWGQIRADLSGRVVSQLAGRDTSPVGAALLAAVAAGRYPDVAAAVAQVQTATVQLAPNRHNREPLEDRYRDYQRLFDSLRPMYQATS